MSYRQDLDEIPEGELLQELARRQALRDEDRCDYCGRFGGESCKFPRRHKRAELEAFDEVLPEELHGVPQRDEEFDHYDAQGLPF